MNNPMRGMEISHSHAGQAHEHTDKHPVAEAAPASSDNLLLDIGADTGALIVHTAAHRDQAEIEISPAGADLARTHNVTRTHNVVRCRQAAGGAMYAAVFPDVPAGDYVMLRDADTPAGTVTVRGGAVASFRFDQG